MEWLIIAIGGGVGATFRYFVQLLIIKSKISSYLGTAIINILGSFILGMASHIDIESSSILFLTVGVLGGFTTFSTFAFDIVKLIDAQKWGIGFLVISVNLIGSISAFSIGWLI